MEIIRNRSETFLFEELCDGAVFIGNDDNQLYMKTSEAYEFVDSPDFRLNAVNLEDGSLVKFADCEKVQIPRKIFLTVEE